MFFSECEEDLSVKYSLPTDAVNDENCYIFISTASDQVISTETLNMTS